MATGRATGGRLIMFMPPIPPGTPVTPTVLTGAPATAGTGKRSSNTKILAALYITAKTLIKPIFLYCNPQANEEYVLSYEAVPANHRGFKKHRQPTKCINYFAHRGRLLFSKRKN